MYIRIIVMWLSENILGSKVSQYKIRSYQKTGKRTKHKEVWKTKKKKLYLSTYVCTLKGLNNFKF